MGMKYIILCRILFGAIVKDSELLLLIIIIWRCFGSW